MIIERIKGRKMEKFLVEFNEYEPKYIQIANNIKKLINDKYIVGGE